MEDDNGLELRLGLSCGKSSTTPRAKNCISSETRTEEVDRGSKIIDDFRNFLHAGTQKSDSVKPEENFFDNLSSPAVNVDASINLNGGEFWIANNNKSSEADEEKRLEVASKSRNAFDEITLQKKRRRDSETTRASHISINTDEGSTAENEDIADSEAEGSTSRLTTLHNDNFKRDVTGGGLNEVCGVSNSSGLEKGQNRFTISSESEPKVRNVSYGIPFPNQSVDIMNMPYSLAVKESNPIVVPGTSKHALPGMHMMATSNGERPANQHMMPANSHLTFGYSPGQLPLLDKENSQGLVPHSQQLNSSYFVRGLPDSEKQNGRLKLSEVVHKSGTSQYDGKVLEPAKCDGNHHASGEEGSSSQTGNNVKQNSIMVGQNTSDQPRVDGCASEFQAIQPGIAGDLKFSGTGSVPDLPWVSTTGSGPKGRTISGVTYRVSSTQVRIVCACHGSHMSPEEFVVHANEEQQINQGNASGVVFPSSNSAASAQS